ncbi:ABC transporter ATP-binding protein [Caldovatus sediminis]|uniref:ABC transporter ATP-binding protein n=1 Tax=Caldovatus sediminis TaxID=2041189 RepID=A0A8J2Z9I4_9PROT|nr:ABC transporter ATP-binding protein [Caldovatus sediminis]GGG23686.1 ABC transporter ATP-binding protein [Caldovatus sediminis]
MSPPILHAEGLRYAYRGVPAVQEVSLSVGEGEIVALLGANGAGKSTTVNMLAGVLRPAAGRVLWRGEDIAGLPAHRVLERGIALVPEGRLIFPQMTVLENLQVAGAAPRAAAEFPRRLEEIFGIFPRLAERRAQPAGSLSGGEQQMLAIARGLVARPELLILDEPSLGLAPMLVRAVFDLVRDLNARGITVLLVEQNLHQSLRVAGRGYVLEKGRVALSGTGAALLEDPYVRQTYLGM